MFVTRARLDALMLVCWYVQVSSVKYDGVRVIVLLHD